VRLSQGGRPELILPAGVQAGRETQPLSRTTRWVAVRAGLAGRPAVEFGRTARDQGVRDLSGRDRERRQSGSIIHSGGSNSVTATSDPTRRPASRTARYAWTASGSPTVITAVGRSGPASIPAGSTCT